MNLHACGELTVTNPHLFPYWMHRQLWATHIDGSDSCCSADQRTNGWTAATILSNKKFLYWWQRRSTANFPDQDTCYAIGSISLIRIPLDDHSCIHLGLMVLFMLRSIIWMECMALIATQYERFTNGSLIKFLIAMECSRDALHGIAQNWSSGTNAIATRIQKSNLLELVTWSRRLGTIVKHVW